MRRSGDESVWSSSDSVGIRPSWPQNFHLGHRRDRRSDGNWRTRGPLHTNTPPRQVRNELASLRQVVFLAAEVQKSVFAIKLPVPLLSQPNSAHAHALNVARMWIRVREYGARSRHSTSRRIRQWTPDLAFCRTPRTVRYQVSNSWYRTLTACRSLTD